MRHDAIGTICSFTNISHAFYCSGQVHGSPVTCLVLTKLSTLAGLSRTHSCKHAGKHFGQIFRLTPKGRPCMTICNKGFSVVSSSYKVESLVCDGQLTLFT